MKNLNKRQGQHFLLRLLCAVKSTQQAFKRKRLTSLWLTQAHTAIPTQYPGLHFLMFLSFIKN